MGEAQKLWVGLLAALNIAVVASLVVQVGGQDGYLAGAALAAGGLAYSLMATNLLLAVRAPFLERLFGPIDKLYRAHRIIGASLVAAIGLHMVLTPIASLVDRGESLLEDFSPAIPLGVLGVIIVATSVAMAMNPKITYHRWQPFHTAVAAGFLLLTAHFIVGGAQWTSLASVSGALLFTFMAIGFVSIGVRVAGRSRGGAPYRVTSVTPCPRGVEVGMEPVGESIRHHQPGQFVFLTASPGGQAETHPFSLTSPSGSTKATLLIRSSGDWTELVQTGLAVGDEVALSEPFGGFTPRAGDVADAPQVWVAAGAGITPFLSVLRTAEGTEGQAPESEVSDGKPSSGRPSGGRPGVGHPVELVYIASSAEDAPRWEEITELEGKLPWLTVRGWHTDEVGWPTPESIRQVVKGAPAESVWYLCGPQQVSAKFAEEVRSTTKARVHQESYQWRASETGARTGSTDRR